MSKFNTTNTNKTFNKSGHIAYDMADKEKLVTMVLTSFFNEQKYYGDNSTKLVKLAEKVAEKYPVFVANLACYARKEMHLRSISHVLTAIVAHTNISKMYTKYVILNITLRADDITEILACYLNIYGKPIPNSLKKGLGAAMNKFNEFDFSKYNGHKKAIKFKDVLNLCHPVPKDETQSIIFSRILNDNLNTAIRWETELAAHGNTQEVWENLIENNQVGYMAALRNLRNILKVNPKNIDKILDKLSNKEEVLKSKQLPFRFLSAYKNIAGMASTKIYDCLEQACRYSVSNLPKIPGTTVIAIDISGSMSNLLSKKSQVECGEIAILLGLIANLMCENAYVYTFNNSLKQLNISHYTSILQNAATYRFCGGTDLKAPLEHILVQGIYADRLILISDNEINAPSYYYSYAHTCESLADKYRRTINSDFWVHAIDLQGYGTQQFIGSHTNIIAGWSERILEFIKLAEEGIDTQVNRIENYHLSNPSK